MNTFSVDEPSQASEFKPCCYVCQGKHYVDQCLRFKGMTPTQRYKIVQEQRACFRCLKKGKGHTAVNCSKKRECNKKDENGSPCKYLHHKLFPGGRPNPTKTAYLGFMQENKGSAILPVGVGYVKTPNDSLQDINVFYDSGA